MAGKPAALIVEDDLDSRRSMQELVTREGFEARTAGNLAEAKRALAGGEPDLILVDLMLPDGSGLDLLDENGSLGPEVVIITGQASVDSVVAALRRGCLDYMTKPVDTGRLRQVLRDVAAARPGQSDRSASFEEAKRTGSFGRLIGRSPEMIRVYKQILRVAPTGATVLLEGETGTGKELVAETIHQLSARSAGPFVALNCGGMSSTLIESELFGHEKGSFTGAARRHIGIFERGAGGTLFLDEITEMPLELQVKLLRVLETREFLRVGGESPIQADVRLLAATNREPAEAVRDGKLREDLFYRLRVFPLQLPPLKSRQGDVELLARRFLDGLNLENGTDKQFTDEALEWLGRQDWPGNVRELRNLVVRSHIMADRLVDLTCVQIEDEASETPSAAFDDIRVRVGSTIAEAEKQLILATLERFRGDKTQTARVLGISVKTLYSRLSVYKAAGLVKS